MAEISYTKVGDYYLPDLKVKEARRSLRKWGMMRRDFLEEYRPVLYTNLMMSGVMMDYLLDMEDMIEVRMETIMSQAVEKNPPPEKEKDPMGWVGHMNMLKEMAEEFIRSEFIYDMESYPDIKAYQNQRN